MAGNSWKTNVNGVKVVVEETDNGEYKAAVAYNVYNAYGNHVASPVHYGHGSAEAVQEFILGHAQHAEQSRAGLDQLTGLGSGSGYIEAEIVSEPGARKSRETADFHDFQPQDIQPGVGKVKSDIVAFLFLCFVIIIFVPAMFEFFAP